jgi:hypothetical protein
VGLLAIAEPCTHLRELHVLLCRHITPECLLQLVLGLAYLRELLSQHMNTTDAVLNAIAQHGARLTVLTFHGCKGYSTSQALSLTRSLSALQRLVSTVLTTYLQLRFWVRGRPERQGCMWTQTAKRMRAATAVWTCKRWSGYVETNSVSVLVATCYHDKQIL